MLSKESFRSTNQNSFDFMPDNGSFGHQQRNMKRKLMKRTVGILFHEKNRKKSASEYLPFLGEKPHFLPL